MFQTTWKGGRGLLLKKFSFSCVPDPLSWWVAVPTGQVIAERLPRGSVGALVNPQPTKNFPGEKNEIYSSSPRLAFDPPSGVVSTEQWPATGRSPQNALALPVLLNLASLTPLSVVPFVGGGGGAGVY